MLQRQGNPPCLGCSVYYAAVGHGKGTWDASAIGGLLKKTALAGFILPSAPPPLLPFFHGADANTPTPTSCEAANLQGLPMCDRSSLSKPCAQLLVPAGAHPMCCMSTSPLSPSRISEADYA